LRRRAMGEAGGEIDPERERQQVSNEATFAEDIGDEDELHVRLSRMTMKIGAKLRADGQWAGTLTLKLRYPDFTTFTRQMPLSPPTNDDGVLFRAAKELLKKTWNPRAPLRLIGVGASGLTDSTQEDLLDQPKSEKRENLLKAMDEVREKQGRNKIVWGTAMQKRIKDEGGKRKDGGRKKLPGDKID
jgi:DNA polymerase-4